MFGAELATRFVPEASAPTVLANLSNIGWFGNTVAIDQHLQISRLRAMETGRPMVRAANDGVSAVIGHRGEFIARAPEYEANVMRASLQPRTGLTPYARIGNWPVVLLALVLSVLSAYVAWVPKSD